MFAVALLVVLGVIECACIRSARRFTGRSTTLVHLALLAAMVAMLLVPGFVVLITTAVLAILAFAAGERIGHRDNSPSCSGQLIACSSSTLAILVLMMMTPAEQGRSPGRAMPGMSPSSSMPGMSGGSESLLAKLPTYLAAAVLVVFLARAATESIRAVRSRKSMGHRALHHGAAVAGSLSMVVMCAAMGAF